MTHKAAKACKGMHQGTYVDLAIGGAPTPTLLRPPCIDGWMHASMQLSASVNQSVKRRDVRVGGKEELKSNLFRAQEPRGGWDADRRSEREDLTG
jgi:hypothetical protein